ncbi:transposable element Tcb2 transposase [Trichonephila clavipes]|uniref:Transposable element Tcb2 transposase n=1 Tax=Trichonephila clavipes TaxID=2585209 RepID=A0A8X6ST84_TRICX|nr:transposable element Tcb2 transposase [Trichonephila clavipes]
MVCGAKAYDRRSTLIEMRGTLTGQRYVDDILRPHVGPFLNGLPGAIFQQDNALPPTARVAQDFICHFQTFHELAVQDLWAHRPQNNIRFLINSKPDRVVACIAAGGGQSDTNTPLVQFQSKLGTHLSTQWKDERLSRPCPARGLNPGPVA